MYAREAIEDFLAISAASSLSKNTIKSRRTALDAFSVWSPGSGPMGEYEMSAITSRHVADFLNFLREREGLWHGNHRCQGRVPGKLRESSVRTYLMVLKTFFRWYKKRTSRKGIEFDDPTADIHQKKNPCRLPQALTLEEVVNLLVAAKHRGVREYALVLFVVDTGCRISEAVVTLNDIDLKRNICVIRGKGNVARPLFFTDLTSEALQDWLRSFQREKWAEQFPDEANYLWLGHKGHLTDSGLRYIIKKTGADIGLKIYPHQLRHTLAVAAFERGAPPPVVSQILGHSSIETTLDIYSVFSMSRLKTQHEKYSTVTQVKDYLHDAFSSEADKHIIWYNMLIRSLFVKDQNERGPPDAPASGGEARQLPLF